MKTETLADMVYLQKIFNVELTIDASAVMNGGTNSIMNALRRYENETYQGVLICRVLKVIHRGTMECSYTQGCNRINVPVQFDAIVFRSMKEELYAVRVINKYASMIKLQGIFNSHVNIFGSTSDALYGPVKNGCIVFAKMASVSIIPNISNKGVIHAIFEVPSRQKQIIFQVVESKDNNIVQQNSSDLINFLLYEIKNFKFSAGYSKITGMFKLVAPKTGSPSVEQFVNEIKVGKHYYIPNKLDLRSLQIDVNIPIDDSNTQIIEVDITTCIINLLNQIYHNLVLINSLADGNISSSGNDNIVINELIKLL